MSLPKRKVIIWVLVMALAILSCKISQEDVDKPIVQHSRITYILCELTGGTWKSEFEDHILYSWCDREVQRSGRNPGSSPIENQTPQPEVPSQTETPQTRPQLPTVTMYQGTTSIGSIWVKDWQGSIIMDEITVFIDRDGTVSGTLISIWESGMSAPVDGCSSEQIRTVTGDLSGKLTENNQKVQIEFTQVLELRRSGCPVGNETFEDSWTSTVNLQFNGNKISGSAADGFKFDATLKEN